MSDPRPDPLVFVVPTLAEAAAQDEDVMQLLLFAAARLEADPSDCRGVVLSVEQNMAGWAKISEVFSGSTIGRVTAETLPEPAVRGLADGNHKAAYDLLEYLKTGRYGEVHCLDRRGIAYYVTMARRLGLHFLDTPFAIHVVGGTVLGREVEDRLLDDVSLLADDLLERGSLERADAVFIHDRKAWQWYSGKLDPPSAPKVYDLGGSADAATVGTPAERDDGRPVRIAYHGALGPEGGLPLFCDTLDRALSRIARPVEIFFVGPPRSIGSMDAVSYIHLRAASWDVPTTIKRDLSLADEIAFLGCSADVVVCDTRRRESLRARLLPTGGPRVLDMAVPPEAPGNGELSSDNPARIAAALVELAGSVSEPPRRTTVQEEPRLVELWRAGKPALPALDLPSEEPLRSPVDEPRVSVCLTHFRRPEKLRAALASLADQTYRNIEVIVVDDGSPEPEVQRQLDELRRQFEPRGWQVITQENRYLGAARNSAAKHASGEYLLFMDDDNVAKPNELSTLVAAALKTRADIVTSFFDGFESDDDLAASAPTIRFPPYGALDPALGVFTNCFGDANALYRRDAFDRIGGFTEDYGITHEDWELFCRASLDGLTMACVPEPLFWYRIDPKGMFRERRKQLHEIANHRRHIRPYLAHLPYHQAKMVQLAQGLTLELPERTVGEQTRVAAPTELRSRTAPAPYARVAVVMRTKDRPIFLRRAIQSVLDQTFGDWLLVIVNDGGEPELVERVVQAEKELAGRVLVLHHPVALGMQTASNAAIARCDSDFVTIHDDDDTWQPSFLARTVSHLDEHSWNPQVGGVVTLAQVVVEELDDEGEFIPRRRFLFNENLEHLTLTDLAIENRFPPISFVFRREAFDAVGPFKETAGPLGDWEFHLRLLARFDILVVREPLANYHHRPPETAGAYGNSVHAAIHRAKRAELINQAVRNGDGAGGDTVARLLPVGEMHHRLIADQRHEFQRLHDYIWNVEQTVQRIASQVGAGSAQSQRNFVRNGDFRVWPGPGPVRRPPGGGYEYVRLSPGLYVSYDGSGVSWEVDRRVWDEGAELPIGKPYLRLENDGSTRGGSWFSLEYVIPSVSALAGRTICLSAIARMKATHSWLTVGGRFEFANGREVSWFERPRPIGEDFSRWGVPIACPAVETSQLGASDQTRIIMKLPHDQPFEFELTDLQVEYGGNPTEFEYRAPVRRRRGPRVRGRLRALRRRAPLRRRQ